MKVASSFKILLLFSVSVAYCDDEEHSNEAYETEEPLPPLPPPPPPRTTVSPPPPPPPPRSSNPGQLIAPLLSEVVAKSIRDSKAMIDEAIRTAAGKIADQVQEKMEQRLKRIETQAEENVLKFNGIALFMVEKFHLKTETVERKIVKSLDSISEVVQSRLFKLEQNSLRGNKNNITKYVNSSIKAYLQKETFNCEGYKRLALLKVRYGKYFVSENMTDWFGAKQFCETHGMELVSFERASEMRAIWQLADASKEFMVSYWTSASDIGRGRGQYLWRDGQAIENELWINGQPEDSDSADDEPGCVSLFIGRLRATSCNYQRYFICEGLKHEKGSALNQKIAIIAE